MLVVTKKALAATVPVPKEALIRQRAGAVLAPVEPAPAAPRPGEPVWVGAQWVLEGRPTVPLARRRPIRSVWAWDPAAAGRTNVRRTGAKNAARPPALPTRFAAIRCKASAPHRTRGASSETSGCTRGLSTSASSKRPFLKASWPLRTTDELLGRGARDPRHRPRLRPWRPARLYRNLAQLQESSPDISPSRFSLSEISCSRNTNPGPSLTPVVSSKRVSTTSIRWRTE